MLMLIQEQLARLLGVTHLNTSHVNVNLSTGNYILDETFYLNTSHVNVNLHGNSKNIKGFSYLNTSHVNVNRCKSSLYS